MNLNDMVLPAGLVVDFYQHHLIEAAKAPSTPPKAAGPAAAKKGLQYLGQNQKSIALLVNYNKDVYLPDEQLTFLTNILQACRLNLGDVAIINHHLQQLSFEELRQQLDCRYLLVFGVPAAAIGVPETPLFTVQGIDGCQVVYSTAAEQLNNNSPDSKLLKSQLWACLKQLFVV